MNMFAKSVSLISQICQVLGRISSDFWCSLILEPFPYNMNLAQRIRSIFIYTKKKVVKCLLRGRVGLGNEGVKQRVAVFRSSPVCYKQPSSHFHLLISRVGGETAFPELRQPNHQTSCTRTPLK